MKNFRAVYCVVLMFVMAVYYQFLALCVEILEVRFNIDPIKAKNLATVLTIETMITTPLFGIFIQKVGRKPLFTLISMVMLTISIITFLIIPEKSEFVHIPIFLLSQFLAIFNTALWPMIALCVPSRSVGFAFSLSTLFFSLAMVLAAVVTGFLVKEINFEGFGRVLWFFLGLSLFGLVLSILLYFDDKKHGNLLSLKESDDRVQEMRDDMVKDK